MLEEGARGTETAPPPNFAVAAPLPCSLAPHRATLGFCRKFKDITERLMRDNRP
jgi:hypothetical protein